MDVNRTMLESGLREAAFKWEYHGYIWVDMFQCTHPGGRELDLHEWYFCPLLCELFGTWNEWRCGSGYAQESSGAPHVRLVDSGWTTVSRDLKEHVFLLQFTNLLLFKAYCQVTVYQNTQRMVRKEFVFSWTIYWHIFSRRCSIFNRYCVSFCCSFARVHTCARSCQR